LVALLARPISRDQHSFDSSPELFAVFHALRSLLTPRHPPCALSSLTTMIQPSHPSPPPAQTPANSRESEGTFVARHTALPGYRGGTEPTTDTRKTEQRNDPQVARRASCPARPVAWIT
jgi:hypothetical protein